MPSTRWNDFENQVLITQWPTLGSKTVAQMIGRPWRAVQRKAVRLKLPCDQTARYDRHSKTMQNKSTSCDVDYFCRDWSANMAYILGYIFADGCLSKDLYALSFRCHSKDEEVLLAIHKELKVENKFFHMPARSVSGRNNGPQTYFNISSKKLVLSLVERFGLCPRKSHNQELALPEIPDDFFGHFFRGYFDGDGHVGLTQEGRGRISFVATRVLAFHLRDTICRLTGALDTKVLIQGSIYSVGWACYQDLVAIWSLMYPWDVLCPQGDYIFLKRKRELFDSIVNKRPVRLVRSQKLFASPN